MACELLDMAQAPRRCLEARQLLPLSRASVAFVEGVQQASKRSKPRARAA